MIKIVWLSFLSIISYCNNLTASSIIWYKQSATVWLSTQTITGEVKNFTAAFLTIHHDDTAFTVPVFNNRFTFNCNLHNEANNIWAESKINNAIVYSDTLLLTLGYKLLPAIKPFATIQGNKVFLHASLLDNPQQKQLNYLWKADINNPASSVITNVYDSITEVSIPFVEGDYNFTLIVISGNDTTTFGTYVTRNNEGVAAFDIETSHAAWINKAIIYQITPHHFVDSAKYSDIAAKLPELKSLGINTICLQPLYKTKHGGQGYDVTDFFSLRPDFGTEEELQQLISAAKNLQMHVLFDFVPNHTSIDHPYAKDCIAKGTASPYYDFYQHSDDGAPYSSYYKKHDLFIIYFWNDLVNLNFKNNEVQQWILEACKYWVRKFDIDGYRFDAMWAVNARAPKFGKRLQQELKSIKPGLLLLAEDKGSLSQAYRQGFDAAYDWTADTTWISQWSWQTRYDEKNSLTIFNYADINKRRDLLRKALFNNGDSTHLRLRFLENNDLPRFIKSHDLQSTKMAAALLFALPGVPMIYNGQEIGSPNHPYKRGAIFKKDSSIQSQDKYHLFNYYQQLTTLRSKYESLSGSQFEEIPLTNTEAVVAFRRWKNNENIIVMINMSDKPATAELDLSNIFKAFDGKQFFADLLENKTINAERTQNGFSKINIDGYTTKILLRQ